MISYRLLAIHRRSNQELFRPLLSIPIRLDISFHHLNEVYCLILHALPSMPLGLPLNYIKYIKQIVKRIKITSDIFKEIMIP